MTTRDDGGKGQYFEKIANNMPLVTVIPEGKFFSEKFFPRNGPLLNEPPKIGKNWLGKSGPSADYEELCGLDDPEPQRYFYAGRADPDYGSLAFAYGADIDNCPGDITPFDSGELCRRNMKPSYPNSDDVKKLIEKTKKPLAEWRTSPKGFKKFLEAFFPDPRDYFHGLPSTDADWKDDLPARHKENRDKGFIAWTWEARIHEEHPLLDGLLFWTDPEGNVYRRLTIDDAIQPGLPPEHYEKPHWVDRLANTHLEPDPTQENQGSDSDDIFGPFEREIQRRLFGGEGQGEIVHDE